MRLFIYEDICGGGCSDSQLADSLRSEGLAMLRALISDFAGGPLQSEPSSVEIVTQWDRRLGKNPLAEIENLEVIQVDSAAACAATYSSLLEQVDASLIVAPECHQRLYRLAMQAAQVNAAALNAEPQAIALCSDKLALWSLFQRHHIPSIPTVLLADPCVLKTFPEAENVVVKPRDGAGSWNVHWIRREELPKMLACTGAESQAVPEMIVQPAMAGDACSVGCFFDDQTQQLTCLPVASQRLSSDGRLKYQGGTIQAHSGHEARVEEMVRRCVDAVPGLRGYFGIDFICPPSGGEPVIVEINPRVTSSYLGYRAATRMNLSPFFFPGQTHLAIPWHSRVTFDLLGNLQLEPLEEVAP